MPEHVIGCTGKVKYASQELAAAVVERVTRERKYGERYTYKCENCGCWHLSSMSPREHKKMLRNRERTRRWVARRG